MYGKETGKGRPEAGSYQSPVPRLPVPVSPLNDTPLTSSFNQWRTI